MRLIWGKAAARDLEDLADYIARDSEQAAELVENRIHQAAKLLLIPEAEDLAGFPELASSLFFAPRIFWFTSLSLIESAFFVCITVPAAGPPTSRSKIKRDAGISAAAVHWAEQLTH